MASTLMLIDKMQLTVCLTLYPVALLFLWEKTAVAVFHLIEFLLYTSWSSSKHFMF